MELLCLRGWFRHDGKSIGAFTRRGLTAITFKPSRGAGEGINRELISAKIAMMKTLPKRLFPVVLLLASCAGITCNGALAQSRLSANPCPATTDAWQLSPPVSLVARSREAYQHEISRIESISGAFAYGLVPELTGLGRLVREAGDNTRALEIFRRAFFLVRMHRGLYSLRQVPLLEMLIRTNADMGRWKQVAQGYDLLYWLYRRNYAEGDPHLLPLLMRLRQWNLQAYDKNTGRSLEQHYRAVQALSQQILSIVKACGGKDKLTACPGKDADSCPGGRS